MDLTDEIRADLMDSFADLYHEAESILNGLNEEYDKDKLNRLFRAVHNMKGNAGMFRLSSLVDFTHVIEEVAASLRSSKYESSELICEAMLLGLDRLSDLHQRELQGKHYENLLEEELKALFLDLAQSEREDADAAAARILEITGASFAMERGANPEENKNTTEEEDIAPHSGYVPLKNDNLYNDLNFFQEISLQIDSMHPAWENRSIQQFDWAMKINEMSGNRLAYEQLAAAVYLHDIGMCYIRPDIIQKAPGTLTKDEEHQIYMHPQWGYKYLYRIPGWEEAAKMVLQHHEQVDGKGYPNGIRDHDIHPGAKIIAIVDAFFTFIDGRAGKKKRHAIVRAVSEINAGINSRFDGMYVQCFNHVIRKEAQIGNL